MESSEGLGLCPMLSWILPRSVLGAGDRGLCSLFEDLLG